jgi:hypothetical protein
MARIRLLSLALIMTSTVLVNVRAADEGSPIFGVTVPPGYRQWQMIAPAHSPPFDELRGVLGNAAAMQAYRAGTLPFPDGTILAKLSWQHVESDEFKGDFVPGAPTTIQFMVKDSKKYTSTGGWGFAKFANGRPVSEKEHSECFACHRAHVKNHDFVFTRFAP